MVPIQTSEDKEGNCLEACLASIFEISISDVPLFSEMEDGYLDNMNEWLLENYGLQALTLFLDKLDEYWIPNGYHMIYGESPRGIKHAVVGYKGAIIHDPHPSNAGLSRIDSYTVFVSNVEPPFDP